MNRFLLKSMNKTYTYVLVLREPWEGDTIFGIYSDLDKAKKARTEISHEYDLHQFKVLEVAMDEEAGWLQGKVVDIE